MKFRLRDRIKSFRYAFNGLHTLFTEEPNALIHLLAAAVVVTAGLLFRVSAVEWLALSFAIGFVFVTEILNSSMERLADLYSTQKDERIRKIKDLAAAGVLVSAVTAVIIGLLVFIPHLLALCYRY
ncbi:MAG: diacylglycerol kinase family protein [Bacteroidota bacterium]